MSVFLLCEIGQIVIISLYNFIALFVEQSKHESSMLDLNLPKYEFTIKNGEPSRLIFDEIRKKYVVLTPEEWVRQHFVRYLIEEKGFARGLIAIEKQLIVNGLKRRTDVVLFDQKATPRMIVECKAPSVPISQSTFEQIAFYNMDLQVDFLVVTNGINHYCCKMNYEHKNFTFVKEVPGYRDLD